MIDFERLNKIKALVELVLGYDTEKLRNENDVRRIQLWNEIKNNESIFEQEFIRDLPTDLREEIASQFSFAELRLASVEQVGDESPGISSSFNKAELAIAPIYDRYSVLDVSSARDLAERMQRKNDIYRLALEYAKEYAVLDAMLDSPQIRKDLKFFFKGKYTERLNKVNEAVQIYIGKFGLIHAVKQIEKSILDTIKQSEKQRTEITGESRRHFEELALKLKDLPELEQKTKDFKDSLDELEYYVANGTEPADLKTLEMMKEEFAKSYASLEKELAARTGNIEQRNSQLDASQAELENYRQEYRRNNQEEKERLVEGELKEISAVKDQLTGQAVTLKRERDALDVKREEITDRVRQLNEIAEGKSIRYISGQDARLCEMNFLARFDTKMQSYPVRFYSPLEKKEFVIRCWNEGDHVNTSVSNSPDKPWNVQSRYSVNEKMFGLFGGKLSKIIVEGVSLNHLEEFEKYNFDSRRANLADFLKTITPIIDKAEIGKYLHVIGIASPTGWDEKVQKEIRSATFAHNYISRFVSICLVDSVTGEVIFNSADERISKFIEYFTPEFDREKVEKIRQYIIGRLAVKEYVVLDEAVAEIKEPKNIVNKVFYDLQHEGKGKIKYIKEVGLVIQTLK